MRQRRSLDEPLQFPLNVVVGGLQGGEAPILVDLKKKNVN